jgi:endonuclease/exonuclease/phosphatase family metal-dependent hydrolase
LPYYNIKYDLPSQSEIPLPIFHILHSSDLSIMAGIEQTSASYTIPVTSYDTALCVLPPVEQCEHVNSLRELYDKAYGRWPAHINLIYPFVAPERLPEAQQHIQAQVERNLDTGTAKRIKLDSAGLFRQRHNSTAILQESRDSSDGSLESLRSLALQALGHEPSQHNFHLTAGQTEDNSIASLEFLISKVRLLPTLDFKIGSLAVLIRERTSGEKSANRMRLWGSINLCPSDAPEKVTVSEHWLSETPTCDEDENEDLEDTYVADTATASNRAVQPGKTFCFDASSQAWIQAAPSQSPTAQPTSLTVSSYNVLVDSEYPPARDRGPLLISTLLSEAARADILVLQEVSDEFLSSLLNNAEIQRQYPFTSHGPPSQPDIGPLPSLRNVIVISRWPFTWELVPFHRRHKGAVVAVFKSIIPGGWLAVAGIHLTCGLTDGSVAAKKVQVHNLLTHLTRHYNDRPWIITGDFNLATSTYTIDGALKSKSITAQTGQTLAVIEERLAADGILDAWDSLRDDEGLRNHELKDEELFDGEEGATFDPRNNVLAAATSGTSQTRPQRYDRILFRSLGLLQARKCNMFGLPAEIDGESIVPSDHYGVRASLQMSNPAEEMTPDHRQLLKELNVGVQQVPHLASQDMRSTLRQHGMFLTDEQESKRQAAFDLLKEVVLGDSRTGGQADIPLVMVAVGSFAMKVDTSASDIDCLCIGSISSKTFFKLARQRLQKAESRGIRILRKVEAGTGTMLELSVDGVPMDLQYCPAARVAERWSDLEDLPASDPIFNLSILSLRKLKPYRDLVYIKRTTPDLPTFRLAYRVIKLWATQRGIYSSKFGYLGGVHITLMLSWVYKRIAHEILVNDTRTISASDLVATFFHHYANFNWAGDMVYDAFFHKQQPRYHRTSREPMVVLGFHSPNSNVAHTSTLPGLSILVKELQTASARLSDVATTWDSFFSQSGSHSLTGLGLCESHFLQSYNSYVSIDIQFWGRTLAKGKSLVGWVESRCLSLVVGMYLCCACRPHEN